LTPEPHVGIFVDQSRLLTTTITDQQHIIHDIAKLCLMIVQHLTKKCIAMWCLRNGIGLIPSRTNGRHTATESILLPFRVSHYVWLKPERF
jgi:hypothetical protein